MGFVTSLKMQRQVIYALILREITVRFGRQSLGYAWAFIEPIVLVSIMITIYTFIGRKTHSGLPLVPFFISGFVPFLAFRNAALRTMAAVMSNRAILVYPPIKPLDIIIARTVLEGLTTMAIFWVMCFGMYLFGFSAMPQDPLGMITIIWVAALLGMALGSVMSVLNQLYPVTEKIFTPFMRFLVFFSGLLFLADDLPVHLREIALYNPAFHIIQASRESFFSNLRAHADLLYIFYFIVPLLCFGMITERQTSRQVILE